MNSKWTWSGSLIAGLLVAACGSSSGSNGADQGANNSDAAWGCEAKGNDRVVCTSATTLNEGTSNAIDEYACAAGEASARCPDEASVKGGSGVGAVLDTSVKADAFGKLSWACLTTGKHQVQCARDLSVSADVSAGVSLGIDLPATCSEADWEPYFAKLASKVYASVGYNIDFPREIFDSHATLAALIEAGAKAAVNPGAPSCYVAEWDLRAQAWLQAVGRGCVNLTVPILVWCQQAANYAPETRQCNASGSWAAE